MSNTIRRPLDADADIKRMTRAVDGAADALADLAKATQAASEAARAFGIDASGAALMADHERIHNRMNMRESQCPGLMTGYYMAHCLTSGRCSCDGQPSGRDRRKSVTEIVDEVNRGTPKKDPKTDKRNARQEKRAAKPKGKRHFPAVPGRDMSICGVRSDNMQQPSDFGPFEKGKSACKRCVKILTKAKQALADKLAPE